ncbi:phosphatase PAP2 family protein [Rhizomonospora bruguierae]|uniref:phosphatase PAP2 family protein n=1 Tax=Rhizomonospora bruguierae TaxID=1581705 RepID=UPI001BD043C2|nr:phosphatase PAP2 family protein [Micromonospora sp. NBRC 107566]
MLWLLLVVAAHAVAFGQVWHLFVDTRHGQLLDFIALSGNRIGQRRIGSVVHTVLNAMSLVTLAVTTAVIGFIALIRRRYALAVLATLLVAGANATAQLLKFRIVRPALGVDVERAGNSFPSGHTAVAASVAVALVLVLPARVRGVGAVLGAGYAALAGVATMSAGWHRPSDAVASILIVGGWAALAGLLLVAAQRRDAVVARADANRLAVGLLAVAGAALLFTAAVALRLTDRVLATPPDGLGRRALLTAYAGSAAGIAGTAAVVMAVVLATVHRVVPYRTRHEEAAERVAA